MRITFLMILSFLLCAAKARAQGNPLDFGRAGPRQEMLKYFAQVQKEVYETVLLTWKRASERDDLAALAALYAENSSYFPPAASYVQTRASIRAYFASFLSNAVGDVDVRLIDFGTSGDLAYSTIGVTYQMQTASGPIRPSMRTDLIVLRRNGRGDWQIQTHLSRQEP